MYKNANVIALDDSPSNPFLFYKFILNVYNNVLDDCCDHSSNKYLK
jgi:hypothetical protein